MARRTQIDDYTKVNKANDLEQIVKDKREGKRATKKKQKRRNRHYVRTLLKHLTENKGNE